MICRIGNFELDEDARELRLGSKPVALQPRVFDLLAMLGRNRHRVVTKEELMATLWPDVVVGEGSLQRAVSLARSALKQGGLDNAIRNYPRQGYRLCVEDGDESAEPHTEDGRLVSARTAYERGEWDAAIAAFREEDSERALRAADLERYATACQCSGRAAESEPLLERAVAAWSAKGDCRGAARAALQLAELAFEAGRVPVASGWLTRGRRILERCEESWEHGFEAYISARMSVATGEPEAAVEHGRRGLAIAGRLGDEEIDALARMYLGYGEIALGNVEDGFRMVDDAAAAVLSGSLGPRAGGIIYCGLIWVCCNRGDWERAAQWSDSFTRWCEREGMTRFSGLCQLHRAEVLSVSGEVTEAENELKIACEQLADYSPFATGDAFRILGELYLMRGELDQAEAAFRRAHDLGFDPQPGLALLQAERGDPQTAIRGLRRSLDDHNWALRQRRGLLLAVFVVIACQNGDDEQARWAMHELDKHPELWESEFHNGAVARARAEVALLDNDTDVAVARMRDAIRSWQTARAGLNLATCRLRLAQLLAEQDDITGATLELDAAESCFESRQAPARVEACQDLRHSLLQRRKPENGSAESH
jgi:DNA-binding winged helix-turn-helix (wHTH) protein